MAKIRQACRDLDTAAADAVLVSTCEHAKGPSACSVCCVVGVVASALVAREEMLQHFLGMWARLAAKDCESTMSVDALREDTGSSGASAACGAADGTAAAASGQQDSTSSSPAGLVSLKSSTAQLAKHDCFKRHFYNEIIRGNIHYTLRRLLPNDRDAPAVLKAAALGGNVAVLDAVLQACTDILDGTILDQNSYEMPVAQAAVDHAASQAHSDAVAWLFARDLSLRATTSSLQLAAEAGSLSTIRCLLDFHGAPERRLSLESSTQEKCRSACVAAGDSAAHNGHVQLMFDLMDMRLKEDGFDGHAVTQWLVGDRSSAYCSWRLVARVCDVGSVDSFKLLLRQPALLHCFATAGTEGSSIPTTPETIRDKHFEMARELVYRKNPNPAAAADKLRFLASLQSPNQLQMDWKKLAHTAALGNWAEGLRVIFFELPEPHKPPPANVHDSWLFRQACCQASVQAAEVLLQVPGPHAVDPRARHQAAMRTACWRSIAPVVRLLLRQTGNRAVEMQVGKRSFFYAALRPMYKNIDSDAEHEDDHAAAEAEHEGGPLAAAAAARVKAAARDEGQGGYQALKLLLGATGRSAVPPAMWAHGGDGKCKRADLWGTVARGPVERQYRDVGWGGGVQRMPRRDMVLHRRLK